MPELVAFSASAKRIANSVSPVLIMVLVIGVAISVLQFLPLAIPTKAVGGLMGLILVAALLLELRNSTKALAQLRNAHNDLFEKNRLLRMTEATVHVGHWRLVFADDSLFWSDETFAIYGLPKGDLPPLDAAIEAFHPDDREEIIQVVETARLKGEPYSFTARLVRPNGEIRVVKSIAQVETDADGTAVAIFGVFIDRTEEFAMRDALVKARDEANAADDAKSAFLAKMSHEIRTPMNGVVGFADLLLGSDLSDKQRHHAELIADSGKALTLLLNDILDLSKIEAGELTLSEEELDLPHLARRCSRMIEPQMREKCLELTVDIDPAVPHCIMGDPLRLRQIFNNLLSNAVKFTDTGSVSLRIESKGDTISCSLSDSGMGIHPERQAMIFDAFTQATASITQDHGGTGLGLTISRELARMMDGDLTVTSAPGCGSTFTLTLPVRLGVSRARPADLGHESRLPTDPHNKTRVLLAEDYEINQMLVAAMAEQCHMVLDIAEDGARAVEMVEQAALSGQPYLLVLMDLQMPNMGGLEATRVIRDNGHEPASLPIVAITANAFANDIEECIAAGMQDHLAKPFTVDAFARMTRRWFANQQKAA